MAVRIPIITDFDGRGIEKSIEAFKQLETNGQKATFALKKAFVPAAAALGALAVAGGKAVDMASDLAETQNKVGVIFGSSAKNVQNFANTANKALGQTQNEALTAASTFGAFGKAAGLAGDDLVTFSTDFVTLASDLASFNNSTPEEATMALGAALRGEAEPLRRFNILLDDATLKAKATELGIYAGSGALTAQQKILAAQKAIMEQSSDAQGDFIETSDGLANQQRILKATLADTTTQIGMALLPAVEAILPLVTAFATWASNNTGVFLGIGVAIGTIATAIVATNVAFAAYKAVSLITMAVNYALAASFTAVQIATGIGIAVVIAGVAAFALYQRQMSGLTKGLGAFNTESTRSNQQMIRMSDSGKLATTSLEKLIPKADDAGSSVDKMAQKIKDARQELEKQFSDALDKAKDKLETAKQAYDDFKQTVSESVTGEFSISGAADAAKEAGTTILNQLTQQATGAQEFSKKVEQLLTMGLSEDALRAVLEAGQEAGGAIANELILGGSEAITGPTGINQLVSDLNYVADALGTLAADKFYKAGVTQGEQYLAGVQSAIQAAEQLLKNPNLKLADVKGIGAKFASNVSSISLAPTTSPTFTGDTSGIMAERGGNNYTVNINGGVLTNAQTGKVVIDAVKSFNRASGPADISVRPISGRY
jgi:hypothetical protein